jgi:hypothetical protein
MLYNLNQTQTEITATRSGYNNHHHALSAYDYTPVAIVSRLLKTRNLELVNLKSGKSQKSEHKTQNPNFPS